MASNVNPIISDYQTRCTRLLNFADPSSAEYLAYSSILQALDQDQTAPPDRRVISIATALSEYSRVTSALDMGPPEAHAAAKKAREIIRKWALDFIHDTDQPAQWYGL